MTGEREKGNTSIAIWCENSSSVVGLLGDLADMFGYVEDDVIDVEWLFQFEHQEGQATYYYYEAILLEAATTD